MLTVTNAWTQHGWSPSDHLISDARISGMIGQNYRDLAAIRRASQKLADPRGYPTVEYHDGRSRYRYDGCPQGIPGRHAPVVTELGAIQPAEIGR